jgi:DNA polymerase-3 subunit epsilon
MEKILILDIETTGFLNIGGSIVEIGIAELNLNNGEVKEVFNSLCREEILTAKHINEPYGWIFRNSDLKPEQVREAPLFEDVKIQVQEILNKYPLGCTAYNNKFDFDFLRSRGIKINALPCPMLLSTNICKLPNKYGYSDYKWPSVEEAWKHFYPDTEYKEKHRGADDAVHEALIVYKLYEMGIFKI